MATDDEEDVFNPTPTGASVLVWTEPECLEGSSPIEARALAITCWARVDRTRLPFRETSQLPGTRSTLTLAQVLSPTATVAPFPPAMALTMVTAPIDSALPIIELWPRGR